MSRNPVPISVIILTHRSDVQFIKALQSAQFAREIMIVDDQSHNQWPELRTKYQFKVRRLKDKLRDFAQVRNQALRQAQSDWVFFLDSDETVSVAAQAEISRLIQDPTLAGVKVKRLDYFLGRPLHHGEAGHTYLLRLGQKNLLKFSRPVHEVAATTGRVTGSSIVIHHQAHTSIDQFISKITAYSRREAEYRRSQSQCFSVWQLCLYPPAKFFYNYLLRAGWRDGWRGLIYAVAMSLHSLMVRVWLYELPQT